MTYLNKAIAILLPALFLIGAVHISIQPEEQKSFTGYEWAVDIFEKAEIARVQQPPYEIHNLPAQLKDLGLEESNILFGRKFASFEQFRQAFESAEQENPLDVNTLTSWDISWHQGVSVHSRVFQIEDRGIAVAFFRPNVIIADLGPYEGSVKLRDVLVERNR